MKKAPTIRQLAGIAGVSRTTVSLALRNHPSVTLPVRKRVQQIAKEEGYRMDPLVSTLMNQLRTARMSRRQEKLAYLTFWGKSDGWRGNTNEVGYFDGGCERATRLGYTIEHFWAKAPNMDAARLSKVLYTRGIRGVIFAPLPRHLGHVTLKWPYFSCSALGLTILKPGLHRASHNYHEGMMLALRTLKRMGYRRFGFANSSIFEQRVKHGWLSGYLTYQHRHTPPGQLIPPLLVDEWASADDIAPGNKETRQKFARWMDQYQPDVVLSNSNHPLTYMREMGIRVPEEVGFASLHRLHDKDPWAGIDRLPHLIGSAAVDLVVAQLQNNDTGLPAWQKTVQIEGEWRDGPTVMKRVGRK